MRIIGIILVLAVGVAIGYALWHKGGGGGSCSPKEVNVLVDGSYKYHLAVNHKTRHLRSLHLVE